MARAEWMVTASASAWDRLETYGSIDVTSSLPVAPVLYPDGIRCGEQDVVQWDSEFGQIEHQANVCAANLLMLLDDYRRQIAPSMRVSLDLIAHCADRYRVSLIAATLRWLSYTQKRAVLVVAREGFIRTSLGPIEIPATSLEARPELVLAGTETIDHDSNVWFCESATEMVVLAEQYDFVLSLTDSTIFGARVAVNFLTNMRLFIGQSASFFDLIFDLAESADAATA